jgi:prepilin-type N-terminal cleavage/methylation domain-containing protein
MIPHRHQQGFTLIEAMVSLLVLTMGIVPAYYLSQASQNVANSIRDNLVAANLAQEGIEVIHGIRDTNWFISQPFDNGLSSGSYEVEWDSELPLVAYQDRYLRLDVNGRYNYASGTNTSFKRRIRIAPVGTEEIKVVSEVTWTDRKRNRKVEVESHLFDWR